IFNDKSKILILAIDLYILVANSDTKVSLVRWSALRDPFHGFKRPQVNHYLSRDNDDDVETEDPTSDDEASKRVPLLSSINPTSSCFQSTLDFLMRVKCEDLTNFVISLRSKVKSLSL
ncbi:unnamed protein product, partial [Brassica oleracea var. botrytis]